VGPPVLRRSRPSLGRSQSATTLRLKVEAPQRSALAGGSGVCWDWPSNLGEGERKRKIYKGMILNKILNKYWCIYEPFHYNLYCYVILIYSIYIYSRRSFLNSHRPRNASQVPARS
jgi:hypothetical protein